MFILFFFFFYKVMIIESSISKLKAKTMKLRVIIQIQNTTISKAVYVGHCSSNSFNNGLIWTYPFYWPEDNWITFPNRNRTENLFGGWPKDCKQRMLSSWNRKNFSTVLQWANGPLWVSLIGPIVVGERVNCMWVNECICHDLCCLCMGK